VKIHEDKGVCTTGLLLPKNQRPSSTTSHYHRQGPRAAEDGLL
jgi:hypothetical protein